MASAKADLNRYFELINRRLPARMSEFVRWLRQPSSFAARLLIAALLIAGGVFSFLPILGLWMLPLGLLLIAEDFRFLQRPLANLFKWVERNSTRLIAALKKWRHGD